MSPEFVSRDAWMISVSASETNRYIHLVEVMTPRHVGIIFFAAFRKMRHFNVLNLCFCAYSFQNKIESSKETHPAIPIFVQILPKHFRRFNIVILYGRVTKSIEFLTYS